MAYGVFRNRENPQKIFDPDGNDLSGWPETCRDELDNTASSLSENLNIGVSQKILSKMIENFLAAIQRASFQPATLVGRIAPQVLRVDDPVDFGCQKSLPKFTTLTTQALYESICGAIEQVLTNLFPPTEETGAEENQPPHTETDHNCRSIESFRDFELPDHYYYAGDINFLTPASRRIVETATAISPAHINATIALMANQIMYWSARSLSTIRADLTGQLRQVFIINFGGNDEPISVIETGGMPEDTHNLEYSTLDPRHLTNQFHENLWCMLTFLKMSQGVRLPEEAPTRQDATGQNPPL